MSFALYLDENVPTDLAESLRQRGFDAVTAFEASRSQQGISDEDQLRFAADEGRAILTFNAKDFVLIAISWASSGLDHSGIILSPERTTSDLLPAVL